MAEDLTVEEEPLHVFDLPQVYRKPTAQALLQALDVLALSPSSFETGASAGRRVNPDGVPKYLTTIVASSLDWVENDLVREEIWELASKRLTERSGRTAQGSFDRFFSIPLDVLGRETLTLKVHEPALTGDNLGFKTWGTSFAMAKHLPYLRKHFTTTHRSSPALGQDKTVYPAVLELGSGTGLLGMAFAAIYETRVMVTDLPEISMNLWKNVEENMDALSNFTKKAVDVGVLDWTKPGQLLPVQTDRHTAEVDALVSQSAINAAAFNTIIAADPIYSPSHPALLTDTIRARLSRKEGCKVLVAYPLRREYRDEIEELEQLLHGKCELVKETHGHLTGGEDWQMDEEVTFEYKIFSNYIERDS